MRIFQRLLGIGLAGLVFVSTTTMASLPVADGDGRPLPSLAPMLEKTMPAVVNIATRSRIRTQDNPLLRDPFFRFFFRTPERRQEQATQSLGSGVIIDAAKGYVLTNNHVIDKAAEITVTLKDGRQLNAKLVGTDPDSDVAVIQIPAENLVAIKVSDSDDVRVGDFVVAIGNPFGLSQTATSGMVSALGRSGLGIEGYENFIQTDASINPGNSGGALVNLRGELIGINTAILAPGGGNVGIGFAIPSNMAMKLTQQLVEYGEVRRGLLGIRAQDLTPDLGQAFGLSADVRGAVVVQVVEDSAAEKAGLRSGDVIVTVNGKSIRNGSELRNAIGLLRVGERIRLGILRDGRQRELVAEVAAPVVSSIRGEELDARLAGATLADADAVGGRRMRIEGVVITEVERGSPAARAGLRPGDVVTSVNRQVVKNVAMVKEVFKRRHEAVLLNVRRGDLALFLILR